MGREYYDGRDNYVIYDEETSYGAGGDPAITKNFGDVQSVTLNMNQNLIRTQGIGDGINQTNVSLGRFDCTGSLNTKPVDFTYLTFGVGTISGSGTTASPYILTERGTVAYAGDTIPSINVELGAKGITNNQVKQITGAIFNSWSLSGREGEEVTSTVSFIGKTVNRGTTIETYAALSERPFTFLDGSVVWGSSDVLSITAFSLNCNIQPNFPREVADRFNKQPTLGTRTYDWTMTVNMYFDDSSNIMSATELLNEFFQNTDTPLTSGALTGDALTMTIREGTSSGDQVLIIQLENNFITSWSENPSLNGGIVSINISGFALAGKDSGAGLKQPIKWYTTT